MKMFLGLNSDGSFKTTDSFQHAILIAPTGSGKGVSYFLPNLLHCEDSIIVHDIKGENCEITSDYRKSIGQKIFIFNSLSSETNKYNPFDFVDKTDKNKTYNDVDKIAHILINKVCDKDFTASMLFINTALELISKKGNTSFGQILAEVSKLSNTENDTVIHLISYLEPWSNPLIANAMSSSDFDIRNFRNEKSTLYIIINNNDINRLEPLMNFMYQHFIDILTSKPWAEIKDKGGVRLFLDEFSTLGKMPEFEKGIAYLRGYRVGLFLTIQNLPQLKAVYKDNTIDIINNTTFRIAFHANDFETANFISKLCLGEKGFDATDIMQLKTDEQIVFNECEKPQKYKKFKYFENEEFKKRSGI
jgi:type IV secretion system protein VirD4